MKRKVKRKMEREMKQESVKRQVLQQKIEQLKKIQLKEKQQNTIIFDRDFFEVPSFPDPDSPWPQLPNQDHDFFEDPMTLGLCAMIIHEHACSIFLGLINIILKVGFNREELNTVSFLSHSPLGVYSFLFSLCRRRPVVALCLPVLFAVFYYVCIESTIKACVQMIPNVKSNKIQRSKLRPGDHIYTWRRAHTYAHHGIYVGDGMVINLIREPLHILLCSSSLSHSSDNPSAQSMYDHVVLSSLDNFLSGGDIYLFEYGVHLAFFLAKIRGGTCTLAHSDPPEDVLNRAIYLLEKGFGVYNLSDNNCEDFAIYCKTGFLVNDSNCVRRSIGRSGQVSSFLAIIVVCISFLPRLSTTSIALLTFMASVTYCTCRVVFDVRVRRNVLKVEADELAAALERSGQFSFGRTLMHVIKPQLVPMMVLFLGFWYLKVYWANIFVLYAMFM